MANHPVVYSVQHLQHPERGLLRTTDRDTSQDKVLRQTSRRSRVSAGLAHVLMVLLAHIKWLSGEAVPNKDTLLKEHLVEGPYLVQGHQMLGKGPPQC